MGHIQLKNLLQRVEFVMVPIANPDGYFVSLCCMPVQHASILCTYVNFYTHTSHLPLNPPPPPQITWLQYPKYRLWRKNVQPLEGTSCAGVDLNRNFDTHWNEVCTYINLPNLTMWLGILAANKFCSDTHA